MPCHVGWAHGREEGGPLPGTGGWPDTTPPSQRFQALGERQEGEGEEIGGERPRTQTIWPWKSVTNAMSISSSTYKMRLTDNILPTGRMNWERVTIISGHFWILI